MTIFVWSIFCWWRPWRAISYNNKISGVIYNKNRNIGLMHRSTRSPRITLIIEQILLVQWSYNVSFIFPLFWLQYYERLHAHISAPGPQAPMLILGKPGCGKSLLLAKWFELMQQRSTGTLLMYHFVENTTTITSDPMVMIRRLTSQVKY